MIQKVVKKICVNFAEYIVVNGWSVTDGFKWIRLSHIQDAPITTEELFELFNKEERKRIKKEVP
jgi:hypothetical protein